MKLNSLSFTDFLIKSPAESPLRSLSTPLFSGPSVQIAPRSILVGATKLGRGLDLERLDSLSVLSSGWYQRVSKQFESAVKTGNAESFSFFKANQLSRLVPVDESPGIKPVEIFDLPVVVPKKSVRFAEANEVFAIEPRARIAEASESIAPQEPQKGREPDQARDAQSEEFDWGPTRQSFDRSRQFLQSLPRWAEIFQSAGKAKDPEAVKQIKKLTETIQKCKPVKDALRIFGNAQLAAASQMANSAPGSENLVGSLAFSKRDLEALDEARLELDDLLHQLKPALKKIWKKAEVVQANTGGENLVIQRMPKTRSIEIQDAEWPTQTEHAVLSDDGEQSEVTWFQVPVLFWTEFMANPQVVGNRSNVSFNDSDMPHNVRFTILAEEHVMQPSFLQKVKDRLASVLFG
ncbi:MAG: hypothetical protein I8H77_13140 [Comamonadaceae bacterium]|nr:hypothetical protein [Comamonadaceae bacterium]